MGIALIVPIWIAYYESVTSWYVTCVLHTYARVFCTHMHVPTHAAHRPYTYSTPMHNNPCFNTNPCTTTTILSHHSTAGWPDAEFTYSPSDAQLAPPIPPAFLYTINALDLVFWVSRHVCMCFVKVRVCSKPTPPPNKSISCSACVPSTSTHPHPHPPIPLHTLLLYYASIDIVLSTHPLCIYYRLT